MSKARVRKVHIKDQEWKWVLASRLDNKVSWMESLKNPKNFFLVITSPDGKKFEVPVVEVIGKNYTAYDYNHAIKPSDVKAYINDRL